MKLFNKLHILIIGLATFTSCESLDQDPYEDLSTKLAFKSVENAEYWRNGFYRSLRRVSYGDIMLLPDVQSDLLNATLNYGNRKGDLQNWSFRTNDSDISSVWSSRYSVLNDINICIEKFPTIPVSSDKEQDKLNRFLGEAYALRAYYFFQLTERFSPKYDASNKSTANLGIPLVTTFDITLLPPRATLEETYNQIESDIDKAEKLLGGAEGVKGSNFFTLDAVKALKARVALTKGDYAKAYVEAKAIVDAGKYPLVSTQEALQKMWHNDETDETIVQLFSSKPDELPLLMRDYLVYEAKTKKYKPDYVPSKWVVDLYDASDIRKSVYFKNLTIETPTGKDYDVTLVYKYPGNPNLYSGSPLEYHSPKIFRTAELYLIVSEAAYKNGDEVNAVKYLNDLRQSRGLSDVKSSGINLFNDIKEERLRELAFEGTRLNDLKRWEEGVKRHSPQGTEYLVVSPKDQYYELDKPANDYRFTWPIPNHEMTVNPNLKQNEGY